MSEIPDRPSRLIVADPLDRVLSNDLRQELARIRELYGQTVTSEQLQANVKGFQSQKGIYKPSGSEFALWIRQTARGPYPDKEPEYHEDGSWTYLYAPEAREGQIDLNLDTNKSLLKCRDEGVPVGVFRPAARLEGKVAYEVLGLAYVEGFDGVHFIMRGEPIDWTATPIVETIVPSFQAFQTTVPELSDSIRITRERRFGVAIRQIYHEKCSLCELGFRLRGRVVGLEAAHIIPVEQRGNLGDVRNGLLLCRNHHALFDQFAWTMDEDLRVRVADDSEFRTTAAANHVLGYEGKKLPNLPALTRDLPAAEAVTWRLAEFDRRWAP